MCALRNDPTQVRKRNAKGSSQEKESHHENGSTAFDGSDAWRPFGGRRFPSGFGEPLPSKPAAGWDRNGSDFARCARRLIRPSAVKFSPGGAIQSGAFFLRTAELASLVKRKPLPHLRAEAPEQPRQLFPAPANHRTPAPHKA